MTIFESEAELVALLDRMDSMIEACSSGAMPFLQFHQELGHLHGYYALDGHESDEEERIILSRHNDRIAWIERILEEVGPVCADEDASKEAYIRAGRFGSREAVRRLKALVQQKKRRSE